MKKIFITLLAVGVIYPLTATLPVVDPFYGQQLANSGFEEWEAITIAKRNLLGLGTTNVNGNEPKHWNSFLKLNSTSWTYDQAINNTQLTQSTGARPGSTGTSSAQLKETSVIGVAANGNMTTGRVNAGSTSATDAANHNLTQRTHPTTSSSDYHGYKYDQEQFNQKITVRPDSITVWVKYNNANSTRQARVSSVLHGDYDVRDPYHLSANSASQAYIVATAEMNYNSNGDVWQRLSIPFVSVGKNRDNSGNPTTDIPLTHTDSQYMLVTFSTNRLGGGGSGSDIVLVDDILLIYTPQLVATGVTPAQIPNTTAATPITVSYTLCGTMEPENGNTTANVVKLQLSDANGVFPNDVTSNIIGTDTYRGDGATPAAMANPTVKTISGSIPAGTPAGAKVRLVTTNYEIKTTEGDTNISNLKIGCDLTLSVSPEGSATVSGEGRFLQGASVPINATITFPAGYEFDSWPGGTVADPSSASTTYTMGATDITLTANIKPKKFDVTLTVNDSDMGTVSGGGSHDYNSNQNLAATANTGYEFVKWTKGGADYSTENPLNYTIPTEASALTAVFQPLKFTVTVQPNDAVMGSVTGGGVFDFNTPHTFTAEASGPGYEFVNWTKGGIEQSTNVSFSYTLVDADNVTLVANFRAKTFNVTLTVNDAAMGLVSGNATQDYNTTQPLTATANTGYVFVNWTKGEAEVSDQASFNYKLEEANDVALSANFKKDSFTFAVVSNNTEYGNVNSEVNDTYEFLSEISIVAAPAKGYHFVNWTNGTTIVSTELELNYIFDDAENTTLTANFAVSSFNFAVVSGNPAIGSVNSSEADGTYDFKTPIRIKATPIEGHEFVNWTNGATVVPGGAEFDYIFDDAENTTLTANFKISRFTLTLNVNDNTYGTVSGGGEYDYNTSVAIYAMPKSEEFRFVEWRDESNSPVALVDGNKFVLKQNVTLTAYFIQIGRSRVELLANYPAGATLSGNGSYLVDKNATIRATATAGYQFVKWINDENEDIFNNPHTFKITEEERIFTFTAILEKRDFSVKAVSADNAKGTADGTGVYQFESEATLTATPKPGYEFVNWTKEGAILSTDAVYAYPVPAAASTVTANFKASQFTVTVISNDNAAGSATGSGTFEFQSKVELTATANTGYEFVNWTVNDVPVSYNAVATYILGAGDVTIVANFKPKKFTVRVDVVTGDAACGTVSGSGIFDFDTEHTLTATAYSGYGFVSWTINDVVVSEDAVFEFLVPAEAVVVKANFKPLQFAVTVEANNNAWGSVSGGGTFDYKSKTSLVATPADNYEFVNWTKEDVEVSTNKTYTYTVEAATVTLTANFKVKQYIVNVRSNNDKWGTASGGGTFDYNTAQELAAVPAAGCEFVEWVVLGDVVSTNAAFSYIVPGQSVVVMANFKLSQYALTVEANNEAWGTVSGGGTHNYSSQQTLTATPVAGSTFVNWTKNGEEVSTKASFTYTIPNEASTLTANFEPKKIDVTVAANNDAWGTVSGGGTFDFNTTQTLTAIPATNCEFVNWTKKEVEVSTEASFGFLIPAEASALTANFRMKKFDITVAANNNDWGTISGGGAYNYGTQQTLTAIPAEGYWFVGWTLNDEAVSEESQLIIEVSEDANYTAHFEQLHISIEDVANGILAFGSAGTIELRNLPEQTTVQLITSAGVYQTMDNQFAGNASIPVEGEGFYIVRLFGSWGEKTAKVLVER